MGRIASIIALWLIAFAAFADDDPMALRGVVTVHRTTEPYFFVHAVDGRDWRVAMERKPYVDVHAGDIVEVDASLEPVRNRHTTRLFLADVRIVGHDDGEIPAPVPMTAKEIYAELPEGRVVPDWYARFVSVEGRVHDFWRRDNMLCVVIDAGGRLVRAELGTSVEVPMPEYFGVGAKVRVRGAIVYSALWGMNHVLAGYENVCVIGQGMDSLEILSRPPFWTVGRVLVASGAAALALILVIAFIQRKRIRERIMAEATARERLRLSHDLHDGFQQLLASCSFSLAATTMAVQNGASGDEILARLKKVETALQHTQTSLRAALWTMNEEAEGPSRFSELVRYAAARLAHWKGVVAFTFSGKETPIARRLAGSLLMILQEAVTNAMRHGVAGKVNVTIRFGEKDMEMIVSDNGRGFDVSRINAHEDESGQGVQGIGLSSMRQRVSALGGKFSIESNKASGTIVTVRLPL